MISDDATQSKLRQQIKELKQVLFSWPSKAAGRPGPRRGYYGYQVYGVEDSARTGAPTGAYLPLPEPSERDLAELRRIVAGLERQLREQSVRTDRDLESIASAVAKLEGRQHGA